MSNTTIQIKRSQTTNVPNTLNVGELAYSFSSDKLFIGANGGNVIYIGGKTLADQVNTALEIANNVAPQIAPAFDTANAAYNISNNAYDKANSANLLAYNTGIGTNTYLLSVISGANTAVGTGANAFTSATISGSNTAVGAGANAFTSATIAGANTAVGAGANTYLLSVISGANTAVGTGANNYSNSTFVKLVSPYQTITGNLAVTGSLTISGNVFSVDTETLKISDPLIYLAGNNYVSDIVDIGFVGNYVNSTGSNVHTGLFRDATNKEYYLFEGYDEEPIPNHIDPNGNNFTISILNASIRTSNLNLNGQNAHIWITSAFDKANSANLLAYNTGIGVNTYLLSVISGANTAVGTGANTYLLSVIDGANTAVGAGANAWSNTKLSNSTGTFAGSLTITGDLITQGNVTLGDSYTDTITLNGSTISLGNNQNIDAGTLFIDGTNNRVGIGTITSSQITSLDPYSRFTIRGIDNAAFSSGIENYGSGQSGFYVYRGGTFAARWYQYIPNGLRNYVLTPGGEVSFTFTTNNYLGIGTTSPTSNLHVVGTANITSNTVIGGTLNVSNNLTLSAGLIANNSIGANGQILTSNGNTVSWGYTTFEKLADTPSFDGYGLNLLRINSTETALEYTNTLDIDELQLDDLTHVAQIAPPDGTIDSGSMKVYVTISGVSPNQEVAYKVKNELNEEIIISSILI